MLAPPPGAYLGVLFGLLKRAFRLGETHDGGKQCISSRRKARTTQRMVNSIIGCVLLRLETARRSTKKHTHDKRHGLYPLPPPGPTQERSCLIMIFKTSK